MTAAVVRFFDNNRWRLGVVYATGRKNVSLLDVGRLRDVKLSHGDADYLRPVHHVAARRLAESLVDHAACCDRQRRRYPRAVVRRVVAELRSA